MLVQSRHNPVRSTIAGPVVASEFWSAVADGLTKLSVQLRDLDERLTLLELDADVQVDAEAQSGCLAAAA